MIGIKDFLRYSSLDDLELSPGETRTAYAVRRPYLAENRYIYEVWMCDLVTGENKRILSDGEIVGNFCWEDEANLFYTAEYRSGETLCRRVNVITGEKTPAAVLKGTALQAWQTGQDSFCFLRQESLYAPEYPEEIAFLAEHEAGFETVNEIPMWSNGQGYISGRRTALYRMDSGVEQRLTNLYTSVDRVLRYGDRLVFTARTYQGRNTEPGLYLLRAGEMPELLAPEGIYRIFNFTLTPDREEAVFAAQDKRVHIMTSDPAFYRAKAGQVTRLPISERSADDSVCLDTRCGDCQCFSMTEDAVYYTTTKEWGSFAQRVTLDGQKTDTLTPEGGSVSGFVRLSDDRLVFIGLRGQKLEELYLCENGKLRQLTDHNGPALDPKEVIPPERFTFDQFGFHVNYVVIPPANFDPSKKYPAILCIHGGAKVLYTTTFHHEMQYLASCGYYVIYGNPHGSDGQGSEFAELLGHYGEKDFADLMKAVDTALALYPNIDPERLGVGGGSYGGIMTNWCVTHTDRFKCGVAQRSICSMVSTFGTADNGFGFVREQMDGDLWTGFDKLWDQSPLKYADKCHTPLLLIHSDEDHRCDYTEAVQMFTALRYLGVESEMVLIRGENHSLSRCGRPVQRIKRLYEIRRWFDKYLMPEKS